MSTPAPHLWEQRDGEPAKWFERFTHLRLMKPSERSYDAAYRAELAEAGEAKGSKGKQKSTYPRASRHWVEYAQKWEWDTRIAAWDKHSLALEAARIEAEEVEARRLKRKKAAERREQMIEAMASPLFRAAANFKADEATLSEMQKMMVSLLDQSRLEFEPAPTQRLDVTTNGKDLPPGVIMLSLDGLMRLRNMGYAPEEFGNLFEQVIEEMSSGGSPSDTE
jgi:hypothetical protein